MLKKGDYNLRKVLSRTKCRQYVFGKEGLKQVANKNHLNYKALILGMKKEKMIKRFFILNKGKEIDWLSKEIKRTGPKVQALRTPIPISGNTWNLSLITQEHCRFRKK